MLAMFQSTHPHGVRLDARLLRLGEVVSIHAPTWGATRNNPYLVNGIGFNPRTHMGCDRVKIKLFGQVRVSIHAPTWGATSIIS